MPEAYSQLPDGIYFGLPFPEYVAQNRLSGSALNTLNKGALVYWENEIAPRLDPDFDLKAHVDEATKSQAEGHAWHHMIIEGPEVFERNFAGEFDASKHLGAIGGGKALKKACEALGLPKSGTIAELENRIRATPQGKNALFISDLKARHEQENRGKKFFSVSQMDELNRARQIIEQYGINDAWLFGGFPEVSILFTYKKRKYKIRIDYMRPDLQIEYKTISNKHMKELITACVDQISNYDYLSSGYLYIIGAIEAAKALRSGADFRVEGVNGAALPDGKWFDRFLDRKTHEYWFLFQQRGKYNHCLMRQLERNSSINHRLTPMFRTGKVRVERAINLYEWYMENNGLERRWLPPLNPKPLDADDFKTYQLEE